MCCVKMTNSNWCFFFWKIEHITINCATLCRLPFSFHFRSQSIWRSVAFCFHSPHCQLEWIVIHVIECHRATCFHISISLSFPMPHPSCPLSSSLCLRSLPLFLLYSSLSASSFMHFSSPSNILLSASFAFHSAFVFHTLFVSPQYYNALCVQFSLELEAQ